MCKDTGIKTRDDYTEEEIFNLNFKYKKSNQENAYFGQANSMN